MTLIPAVKTRLLPTFARDDRLGAELRSLEAIFTLVTGTPANAAILRCVSLAEVIPVVLLARGVQQLKESRVRHHAVAAVLHAAGRAAIDSLFDSGFQVVAPAVAAERVPTDESELIFAKAFVARQTNFVLVDCRQRQIHVFVCFELRSRHQS